MSVVHGKRICIDSTRIAEGTVVRIKSKEWYETNKNDEGKILCGRAMFVPDMQQFLGKDVTVSYVVEDGSVFSVIEDGFFFTPQMVEFIREMPHTPSQDYTYTI